MSAYGPTAWLHIGVSYNNAALQNVVGGDDNWVWSTALGNSYRAAMDDTYQRLMAVRRLFSEAVRFTKDVKLALPGRPVREDGFPGPTPGDLNERVMHAASGRLRRSIVHNLSEVPMRRVFNAAVRRVYRLDSTAVMSDPTVVMFEFGVSQALSPIGPQGGDYPMINEWGGEDMGFNHLEGGPINVPERPYIAAAAELIILDRLDEVLSSPVTGPASGP